MLQFILGSPMIDGCLYLAIFNIHTYKEYAWYSRLCLALLWYTETGRSLIQLRINCQFCIKIGFEIELVRLQHAVHKYTLSSDMIIIILFSIQYSCFV